MLASKLQPVGDGAGFSPSWGRWQLVRMHFRLSPSRLVCRLEAEVQQEYSMHQLCTASAALILPSLQKLEVNSDLGSQQKSMGICKSSLRGWTRPFSTGEVGWQLIYRDGQRPVYHEGMWWSCRDGEGCSGLLGVMNCGNTTVGQR